MFAALTIEREPPVWADFPGFVRLWLQTAGGLAAFCLLIWCIAYVVRMRGLGRAHPAFVAAASAAGVGYLILALWLLGQWAGLFSPGDLAAGSFPDWLLTISGMIALAVVAAPILHDLVTRIRWQRIWAMAHLSIKEALHSRIILVFSAIALVFLFAAWFMPSNKMEDQLRNYVRVVYLAVTILFLLAASVLGAFSIPNDVKNQSIHTIVTKPVETFEIVLGRFVGYGTVLSVGLAAIAALSLIYIVRGVNEDAARETQTARVPIYARIDFARTKGESVGRMFETKIYIPGPNPRDPNEKAKYAYWTFHDLPGELGTRSSPVPFEFSFDIFRLTKGIEGKGVFCDFAFADPLLDVDSLEARVAQAAAERSKLKAKVPAHVQVDPEARKQPYEEIEKILIEQFGVYEVPVVEVRDYKTQTLQVPPFVFKHFQELRRGQRRPVDGRSADVMSVWVHLNRTTQRQANLSQMLGVSRHDLYILAAQRPFWLNFLKGVVGLWFAFLLVLGVAVAASTYLSGVISWLCTIFLYGASLFKDRLEQLAEGRSLGGGPFEAFTRLVTKTQPNVPLDPSPGAGLLVGADDIYRWWLRRFLSLVPDVSRFDLSQYVANGFDIPWTQVLFLDNLLPLLGFMLPVGVLAYYLMKFREIANPT